MSAILARLPPYSGIMLSTSRTSAPRATSRRAMAEPIRPRPPVITARAPVYTSRLEFTLPRHRTPRGDLRSPWVIAATPQRLEPTQCNRQRNGLRAPSRRPDHLDFASSPLILHGICKHV